VWNLKEKQQDFTINWSILKRAASFSSGGKRCNLCLQEKLCISKADKSNLLNRRRELFSKCVHQKRFLAGKLNVRKLSHASNATDINDTKQGKLVEHTSSPEDREDVKLGVATSLILSRKDNNYKALPILVLSTLQTTQCVHTFV
jgi:hypothetical protein